MFCDISNDELDMLILSLEEAADRFESAGKRLHSDFHAGKSDGILFAIQQIKNIRNKNRR